MTLPIRLSRQFPASAEALGDVLGMIDEACRSAGAARPGCLRLSLLVEELFTNTFRHGCGGRADRSVWIDLEMQPARARLAYADDGVPFDPLTPESAGKLDLPAERRPVGGMGLALIRSLSREACYRRDGELNRLEVALPLATD